MTPSSFLLKKDPNRKKSGYLAVVVSLVAVAWLACGNRPAGAVPPFLAAFQSKYVKADSSDAKEAAFAKSVAAAKCAVCHAPNNKKIRNDYGKQVGKLLRKSDAQNSQKIQEALDKIAKLKCDPAAADSATYGEKIASGKLPAEK